MQKISMNQKNFKIKSNCKFRACFPSPLSANNQRSEATSWADAFETAAARWEVGSRVLRRRGQRWCAGRARRARASSWPSTTFWNRLELR